MFDVSDYTHLSNEELKETFAEFCPECWGSGFGDCNVCKDLYNKELARREDE